MTNESQITQLEKRARGFRRIISALNDLPMYGINPHLDKIHLHFKKENAGVIKALLRECNAKFDLLTEDLEKIASDVSYN